MFEGNLRFKIDWASLMVERRFTVFAVFCFVQVPGRLIFEGAI